MTMTVDGNPIGKALYGTTIGIVDYSRKERDEFGDITIIERGYTDRIVYQVAIATDEADQVRALLAARRATKAEYIGDDGYAVTRVEGYLNNFKITLDNFNISYLQLDVESELHNP